MRSPSPRRTPRLRRAAVLAAATALALTAPAASWAGARAAAAVTGLTLTVVDLQPGDDLPASLAFDGGSSLVSGELGELNGADALPFARALPQAWVDLADGLSGPGASAQAAVTGNGGARAAGSAADGRSFAATAISGWGLQGGRLLLGAGTRLQLSLRYSLWAEVDLAMPGCTACDAAQASFTVVLGLDAPGTQAETRAVAAWADALGPVEDRLDDTLELVYDNPGTSTLALGLGLTVAAAGDGHGPALVVPEPATAALWLAGLAVLAGRARQARPAAGRGTRAARG